MYDRVVIQDILKEIAQTQQVDLNAKQRFKGWLPNDKLRRIRKAHVDCSRHHQRGRRLDS